MRFGKHGRGRFWLTTTAVAGGMVAFGLGGAGITTARAQTAAPQPAATSKTVTVSVPAGPLENAILSFGRQANLRMVYPSAITRGRNTSGVNGCD